MTNKYLSLEDFKDSNIEKAYNANKLFHENLDLIEKGAHKQHKYLRIENGKYIYDYDKMSVKDHKEASQYHRDVSAGNRDKNEKEFHDQEVKKHEKLAKEKGEKKLSSQEKEDVSDNEVGQGKEKSKKKLATFKGATGKIFKVSNGFYAEYSNDYSEEEKEDSLKLISDEELDELNKLIEDQEKKQRKDDERFFKKIQFKKNTK